MRDKLMIVVAITGLSLAGAALAANALLPAKSSNDLVGLRLLTESQYRNTIADVFSPAIKVQGRFEPGRRVGGLLSTSSAILSVTRAGFESYSKMADGIASQVVDEKNRAQFISCAPKVATAADDKCAGEVLGNYGRKLYRRPLTEDELTSRVALAGKIANGSGDFYTGLRYSLASLMAGPNFLFRSEFAVPTGGKNYTLDAYSRASRLSYLLWDTTPDEALLQAAESGELSTAEGVAKQVDRMMASPRLEVGMRAFYSDMLSLDHFSNITKDTSIYPKYNDQVAEAAQEETLRTVISHTLKENGDFRELMTTRKTFVNRVLASIYGVPFNFKGEWVPYEFPEDSGRSGLLTQTAMLQMFSHPGRSSPTQRGVAVLDIFMCEPTPLPPGNVDFAIVNDTNNPKLKTVRDRLEAHATNPTCASCHNHTDPIGLALEQFDSVGWRRISENGAPIDVSASISGKKFVGAAGLGEVLRDDPKIPACFARKLYSYGVGADSEGVTPSMFSAAYKAFTDDGYRLRSLVKALANSPEFYSAPAPEPIPQKTAMN